MLITIIVNPIVISRIIIRIVNVIIVFRACRLATVREVPLHQSASMLPAALVRAFCCHLSTSIAISSFICPMAQQSGGSSVCGVRGGTGWVDCVVQKVAFVCTFPEARSTQISLAPPCVVWFLVALPGGQLCTA
ncbi:hypothetical protein AWZ03_007525 [Drosophila navojoa]|uniref:Uncharacterized protein n=1 Tax=Drosophila navojoa TaxID=7232 RepID=A0A484BB55_DRONA|nr:hypothetical protein AWZ03_007525 [Drosophila navojoa]